MVIQRSTQRSGTPFLRRLDAKKVKQALNSREQLRTTEIEFKGGIGSHASSHAKAVTFLRIGFARILRRARSHARLIRTSPSILSLIGRGEERSGILRCALNDNKKSAGKKKRRDSSPSAALRASAGGRGVIERRSE